MRIQLFCLFFFVGGLPLFAASPWEKVGSLKVPMERISGVAFTSGSELLVSGSGGIWRYGTDGREKARINLPKEIEAVYVSPSGLIYGASRDEIFQLSRDGELLRRWELPAASSSAYVTGLAASKHFVFVADAGGRRLLRFAADGDFVDSVEDFMIPSPSFDCALAPNGGLWVTHPGKHRLEEYDDNLNIRRHWGQFGAEREDFAGCCNPTNFAFFPDGRLATTEKGTPRMKIYDQEGEMLAYLGTEFFHSRNRNMDVAVDGAGCVALVDNVNGQIRFFKVR